MPAAPHCLRASSQPASFDQRFDTASPLSAATQAKVVSPAPSMMPQPKPAVPNTADIEKRIHNAVIARLGNQVDAKLLDNIIHRVVKGIGLK